MKTMALIFRLLLFGGFAAAASISLIQADAAGIQNAAVQRPSDPRSRSNRDCRDNAYNCVDTPNPLPPPDTVWLEELTWMDVRDAMKAGKTTIIISTGGIEANGPWLALGKHNYVIRANCDAIARKLGNALCAPVIPLVPEGSIDPPRGAMDTVGTISMQEETYEAMLTDVAHSLKMHGFENIIFIGDSGGNLRGMKAVALKLNTLWNGHPVVAHIQEYYDDANRAKPDEPTSSEKLLAELGVIKPGQQSDHLHDAPWTTLNVMMTDPKFVRWRERVKLGKASIDGVSIGDKTATLAIAKKMVDMRAANTAAAIKKAIANRGQ